MSLLQIFEVAISMVTALLGLAYPLFIDKINAIAKEYKSQQLSERFRNESSYAIFNLLLIFCIVEVFVFPFVIGALHSSVWETVLFTIQGISVFVLSMSMVSLYFLLLTYNDPIRLFERIRAGEDEKKRVTEIGVLMKYAATDEEHLQLYNLCVSELSSLLLEYKQKEKQKYAKKQNG